MPADLTGVLLVVRRLCSVCEGTGEVDSDEWEEFHRQRERGGETDPEEFFLGARDYDSVPPMKRECGACEEGRTEDTMSVEDLIDAIVARVPTAVIPADELRDVVDSLKTSITAAASKSQGLADADEAGSWLRVVQEGAEALRSVTDLLVRRED